MHLYSEVKWYLIISLSFMSCIKYRHLSVPNVINFRGEKKHEKRKSNLVHLCTMKSWPPFCSEVNHLFSIFPGHVSYPVQLFSKKDSATNMSRDRCLTFWPLMAILNSFIRTGVFSENHFATNFTYFGICSFVNFSGGMTTIVSRKYCKTSAERQIQIS